jgi:hypothetical protein
MNHPNNNCLRIETIQFSDAMFQKSVDATYIIHLENNGRLSSIQEQLKLFHPTNIVYIVFNKGFTKCNKNLPFQQPPYDLVDTFLYCLQDAEEKGLQNILILEDDFIFSEEIYKSNHLININHFLIEKKNEKMLYFLGCLLWVQLPYNSHTSINLLSSGTHSVIYTKPARKELLKEKKIPISDWDVYNNSVSGMRRYVYYKPLCYQLFPVTENYKHWYSFWGFDPVKLYIKYYNLDTKLENGYSNTYLFSKIISYLFLLCVILILFFIGKYIFEYIPKINHKNKKGKK